MNAKSDRIFFVILAILAAGCATAQKTKKSHPETVPQVERLLPTPPAGFEKPVDVSPRDRANIFEQINGGSFSYLENGLTDALFATYPRSGGEQGVDEVAFEVYRFKDAKGAMAQFEILHAGDGNAWAGAKAVVHEYGVELVRGRLLIRSTYNDGPQPTMQNGAESLAKELLARF